MTQHLNGLTCAMQPRQVTYCKHFVLLFSCSACIKMRENASRQTAEICFFTLCKLQGVELPDYCLSLQHDLYIFFIIFILLSL